MKLDWIEEFADPYLQSSDGQGVLLAGISLGMIARNQISPGEKIDAAPMFKQIVFGRMQRRDLLRHLSRVPELIRAYKIPYEYFHDKLAGKAGELLLKDAKEMGVDGNFAFSVAFLNANEYFWRIFGKEIEAENKNIEGSE